VSISLAQTALTTNLTAFFREAHHFPILAEHARSRPGNYSVWSTRQSAQIFMAINPRFRFLQHLGVNIAGPDLATARTFPERIHARSRPGNYSVWSTAASTGEEPYSIAITLGDALGERAGSCQVWASDIDTQVLEKAAASS
jgi:chemotaxis methyl-accepting protein methylase